jgi:hypothetical protein
VTALGVAAAPAVRPRAALTYLFGLAGLAFSLTILWLSMRAVMGIGGACASGGPYVPSVQCPDAVVALTPLSAFGLFIFGGLAWWGGASISAGWGALVTLAWPALFLSLGWNFLEFGLWPPGGEPGEVVWSWLFCAVVFGLMGGVPLAVAVWGFRAAGASSRSYAGGRVVISPRRPNTLSPAGSRWAGSPDSAPDAPMDSRAASRAHLDLASRLERLARLRDAGDLTPAEFDAAKRATIDEAS